MKKRSTYEEALQEFMERVSTLFNRSGSAKNISDFYSENAQLTVKEKRDETHSNVRTVSGIADLEAYFSREVAEEHQIVEGKIELPFVANGTVTAVLVGNTVGNSARLGRVFRVVVIQIVNAATNQFRIITDDVELTFTDQTSSKLSAVSSCSSTSLQVSDSGVDIGEGRLQPIGGSEDSTASSSTGDYIGLSEAAQMNPVGYLYEYCQKSRRRVQFEEVALPDGTAIYYQAVVWIDDEQFPAGQGSNKKDARREAARIALGYLRPQSSSPTLQPVEQQAYSLFDGSEAEKDAEIVRLNLDAKTVDILKTVGKHPVCVINEYYQRQKLPLPTYVDELLPNRRFRCVITANGECLGDADGQSKKDARTYAAVVAINKLVVEGRFSADAVTLLPKKTIVSVSELMDNATVYDQIAYHIHEKFQEAAGTSTEVADSGKVVAGIVLTDITSHTAGVISWATGNRCVKGSHLSQEGTVVNDCHAEILSRRGLLRFLYNQIEEWLSGSGTSIFVSELRDGKLQLREGLSFHLYINTAPCGDGRVFSMAETEEATAKSNSTGLDEHQPLMTDPKKQGVLRTKIESGEGTIPVLDYANIQTLDGITGGERLRTMSCSDKILKWNVLGLQGALLSKFLHPIYLASISIGTLYHHGHLSRAVCCRAGAIGAGLEKPFRVTHPILAKAGFKSNMTRNISKSTSVSANWNHSDDSVEIVDGQTGMIIRSRQSSRLCKRELFGLFRRLCMASNSPNLLPSEYYGEVKASAFEYRLAQRTLFAFLSECAMGGWLSKPQEEKLFR